jgi:molecular chaperone HtpG
MVQSPRRYYAYGSILEALSFGLYPDKKHVLREFIQNAFDAVNHLKDILKTPITSPIEIRIEPPSIFIADMGVGMSEDEVEKYRFLGYSDKDKGRAVGFRGIGKDSGLSVAEKIIVTTSKIGVPKRYMITIDALSMLNQVASKRNPPLEELLEKHSDIAESSEDGNAHYTFVELHNIRKDAKILFDIDRVEDYLRKICPLPFDPEFKYVAEVETSLRSSIADFSHADILLNGTPLCKPFPLNYTKPEYERIFKSDDEGSPLTAFCWYCGHSDKGQFKDKENSGLIYRVKNFAIGDRDLTRQTLWHTTPERAFYFFGEIHVLDPDIIPSTDRVDFEDNDARGCLYKRCRRIAQVLSQRAAVETDQRRLEEKTKRTETLIAEKKRSLLKQKVSNVLKEDIQFQIRRSKEDIEQRLKKAKGRRKQSKKNKILIESADRVIKESQKFLKEITGEKYFYKPEDILDLSEQSQIVYKIIIDCIREEFKDSSDLLEKLITKIDQALMRALKKP